MAHEVLVVLAEGFEEVEAVTIIDILRRAKVDVVVAGLDAMEVKGSHGIRIGADRLLSACPAEIAAIVLPGGMPGAVNLAKSADLLARIREAFRGGRLCAAICAAPTVLGAAGILRGRRATCFPGFEEQLTGAAVTAEAVVVDGNIITSRGVGTALPFALELVRYLAGGDASSKVASAILFQGERGGQ